MIEGGRGGGRGGERGAGLEGKVLGEGCEGLGVGGVGPGGRSGALPGRRSAG